MSKWLDGYYRLCHKHGRIISKCGCGQSHVQVYSADRDEIDAYFEYYRRFWGTPKGMKTYKFRKPAFEQALKRAKCENAQMMVIFNQRHEDMVVRKNVGQTLRPDQVLVATAANEDGKFQVVEANHSLDIPLNRKERRKK